ncbi:MAG: integrase arm-type DNA-binding domain-containing protein [Hyphomonadaceae bacterium]
MKFGALTHMQAKNLSKGKHSDGQCLWLWKSSKQRGQWVLRLVVKGKRREMGLGGWPEVSISEAREHAAIARKHLRHDIDPIELRKEQRLRKDRVTVQEAIEGCFEARQAELKGDGLAGRWMSPLSVHVIPKIGNSPIEDLDQLILKKLFAPIWHAKPSAAAKALGRINLTLKHAAALGLDVDLQATMKARALLGKQRHTVKHIESLPYTEAPAFYSFLCQLDTVSRLALRFLMLTVCRSGELRFATYDEVDGDVWTIPAKRTKTGKEHRIPLVPEALKVIELARNSDQQSLLFPSPSGKPLSDAAMAKLMTDNNYEARPHGLRATFRTWAENESDADWETKETALGHRVGSAVERAYQRSDLLEKRTHLLELWEAYLNSRKSI